MPSWRKPKEQSVESYLCEQVHLLRGEALKFQSPGRLGAPDRIVILPGPRLGFVELKRPKDSGRDTRRAGQKLFHRMLKRMGLSVETAYTKREVDLFIKQIQNLKPMGEVVYFDELLS